MHKIKALLAALAVTALIGLAMLAIGVNALWSKDRSISEVNAAAQPAIAVQGGNESRAQAGDSETVRELRQELEQANRRVQQLEQVLAELQRRGIVRIGENGEIELRIQPSGRR